MSLADPTLENWYRDAETDRIFRIVAIDIDNDAIEVQFLNGDLGEYDTAMWLDSAFYSIEPPKDWSAPYDHVDTDDLGYSDPDLHGHSLDDVSLEDFLDGKDER